MKMARFLLATIFLLPFFPTAIAEEQGPAFVSVLRVSVKPGMQPQYEQLVKRFIEANNKLKTEFYWNASIAQFGPSGNYNFAVFHDSLATVQNNPTNPMAQAFGEDAALKQAAGIAQTTNNISSGLWIARPELSVAPPENITAKNLSMLYVTIKTSGQAAYNEYMLKSVEASRAVTPDAYYYAYSPSWGADDVWVFVSVLPDLGELGTPPLTISERLVKHFGKREGNRLIALRESLVVAQRSEIRIPRQDLSRNAR